MSQINILIRYYNIHTYPIFEKIRQTIMLFKLHLREIKMAIISFMEEIKF